MKCYGIVVAVALAVLIGREAASFKLMVEISPANAARAGFTVAATAKGEGMVRYRVTRDTSLAHWPKRDAYLEVRGKEGVLIRRRLKGEKHPSKPEVSYGFDVAKDRIAGAHLTITEVQTADDTEDGEELLGGGTYYELHLSEFKVRRVK